MKKIIEKSDLRSALRDNKKEYEMIVTMFDRWLHGADETAKLDIIGMFGEMTEDQGQTFINGFKAGFGYLYKNMVNKAY